MDIMPNYINKSWDDFISNEKNIEILKSVRKKIGDNFYPRKKEVLRFLKNDLNNTKCILMGMDPYKQDFIKNGKLYPVATGRSFEIRNLNNWNDKMNKSLINVLKKIYLIYHDVDTISIKEIRNQIINQQFDILPPNHLFNNLENQGVIFLNSSLTLLPNESGSHIEYWKPFMDEVIKYINDYNINIKWLLFGNDAQNRVLPLIENKNAICTIHPIYHSFINEESFEKIKSINWTGTK